MLLTVMDLKVVTSDFLTASSVSPSRTLPESHIYHHCFSYQLHYIIQCHWTLDTPTFLVFYSHNNCSDFLPKIPIGLFPKKINFIDGCRPIVLLISVRFAAWCLMMNEPPCTTRMSIDVGQAGSNSCASRQISANLVASSCVLAYHHHHIIIIIISALTISAYNLPFMKPKSWGYALINVILRVGNHLNKVSPEIIWEFPPIIGKSLLPQVSEALSFKF